MFGLFIGSLIIGIVVGAAGLIAAGRQNQKIADKIIELLKK